MLLGNKPLQDLKKYESTLNKFLYEEKITESDKKLLLSQSKKMEEHIQNNKDALLQIMTQEPKIKEICLRLEEKFKTEIPTKIGERSKSLMNISDLAILKEIHTYQHVRSLEEPPIRTVAPKAQPKNINPQNITAVVAPVVTPLATPIAPTHKDLLQQRAAETKDQRKVREKIIIDALNAVIFQGQTFKDLKETVIGILQTKGVLPSSLTPQQLKDVTDFLQAKKSTHPFMEQPRFKFWIGEYLRWKYLNDPTCIHDTISCSAEITAIKNDLPSFLSLPLCTNMLVVQATQEDYFHAKAVTQPSSATPSTTNTPSAQPNTLTATKETRQQREERFARENMIDTALRKEGFSDRSIVKIRDGVIRLLQDQKILGQQVAPQQVKCVEDFLRDKKDGHPFRDQPRFKFWIAQYLYAIYKQESQLTTADMCLQNVEMIRDDIDGFLREPSVVALILEQVKNAKLFVVQPTTTQQATSGPATGPTPTTTPTITPNTPSPTTGNQQNRTRTQPNAGPTVAPNVKPKMLNERYIWLPARTHLTVDTVGKADSFFQELAKHPMQIDGVETKVTYKPNSTGSVKGKLQGLFIRETVAQTGDNPNFALTSTGEARSLGNDGKQYTHEVRVGRVPGKLVASTTPNEMKQECSALANMLLVCPDVIALYKHLHQTDPVFYPEELIEKLTAYAHAREQQLPGTKTISLFEFSHLFAPASRDITLQYLITVTGLDETDIVELQNFIDVSAATPDASAPDPDLPTQEEIRQAALDYLLNPYVINTPEKVDEQLQNSPSFKNGAETLCRIEKKYGKQTLTDMAKSLREQFQQRLQFIEGSDGNGMSWAYRDIAKQYNFFTHPETHADQASRGYVVGNPMEDVQKQKEIVDRMYGWYIYSMYTQGMPIDHPIYQMIEFRLSSIPSSRLKQEIMDLLQKLPTDGGRVPIAPNELSSRDLAHLGDLFMQILPAQPDQFHTDWFYEPFFADCREETEWKKLNQEIRQCLHPLLAGDPAHQPWLIELETDGLKNPFLRAERIKQHFAGAVPAETMQTFERLLDERKTYRSDEMQRIHGDDALRTDIRNAVLAQLDQSHTDAQRAILTSYIPDDDLQNIQDTFLEQRKHMTDFSRTPTTLYTHVLTALLQQQQDAYIAKSALYDQAWDAMIKKQESNIRHGFNLPFYIDCSHQTEREECMHTLKEELTVLVQQDASYAPYLQELESVGGKQPRVRQHRMQNELSQVISDPLKNQLQTLMQERGTYRAERAEDMRSDANVHDPLYLIVVAEIEQSLPLEQQAEFASMQFDLSSTCIADACANRWDTIQDFPATPVEVYTQILKQTLEQQWHTLLQQQQESIVRHGFDQTFYVDCDNQEERIECMRDFKEELTAYALHDPSFQPELQELESDGSKEPRVRQRRMNNRLTDAISNPVKYQLDALMQEREDYWAEQMHAMRADVTIHESLYEQARAEMQQSFTPTQQTAFENIDFDISAEHLDDVCGDRWNDIEHFPATPQEAYAQILKHTLEQQWLAHCTESGEVAQWVGDGSESIVETLRRNDELDRDNLHRDWMDNRDKYMREDYDLQVLRNTLENTTGKISRIGRRIDLQFAILGTKAEWKYKRWTHNFKEFESYYKDKVHKHDGRNVFISAPQTQRTAQQDPFFQTLGVNAVQMTSGVNGTQEVEIVLQNGTQTRLPINFGLTQNERYQPHKILEQICNSSLLATPEQKRAAQRCYLKTSVGGVLQRCGALTGEYQDEKVTISLDHRGALRILHGDEVWSEQSLEVATPLQRNQQLWRVNQVWQHCFTQAGETIKKRDEVNKGYHFETKRLERFARKGDPISSKTEKQGQGDQQQEITTRHIPDQESLNYFTFNVAGNTYAWSAGKRYRLKTQVAQGQPTKLIFDAAYESREALLTSLGNNQPELMQTWTQAYLQQRLRLHQDKKRQLVCEFAGSWYRVSLEKITQNNTTTEQLCRHLLASKPSPEYQSINTLADGQRTTAGVSVYNDDVLVVDTQKEEVIKKRWFGRNQTTLVNQVGLQDLIGNGPHLPPQRLTTPPLLTDIDSLNLLVKASQAYLK